MGKVIKFPVTKEAKQRLYSRSTDRPVSSSDQIYETNPYLQYDKVKNSSNPNVISEFLHHACNLPRQSIRALSNEVLSAYTTPQHRNSILELMSSTIMHINSLETAVLNGLDSQ